VGFAYEKEVGCFGNGVKEYFEKDFFSLWFIVYYMYSNKFGVSVVKNVGGILYGRE